MRVFAHLRRHLWLVGAAPLAALAVAATPTTAELAANQGYLAPFVIPATGTAQPIEYKTIDKVLEAFVVIQDGQNAVRYTAIKGEGERVLDRLVSAFGTIDPMGMSYEDQLAYWLNLRTLLILSATANSYPNAHPEQFLEPGSAFLTTKRTKINNIELSIADIDAILLTRATKTPLIVYGLTLPVYEAPAIPRKAYRGETLNATLDEAARSYVNRSGAVKTKGETATVAAFLITHRPHLGGDDAALLAHIRTLADPKLGAKLMATTQLTTQPRLNLNAFSDRSFADSAGGFGNSGNSGGGRSAGS